MLYTTIAHLIHAEHALFLHLVGNYLSLELEEQLQSNMSAGHAALLGDNQTPVGSGSIIYSSF